MSCMKSIFSLIIQSMLELHLELMNPRSLIQNDFWHSEASLLWKSPGFCEQDRGPTPSACLLPLLWLMSTAQVTGNWVLIDDSNRFATLVADVRKTASYLTDVSPCIARVPTDHPAPVIWRQMQSLHTESWGRQTAVNQGTAMTQMYRLFPTDCWTSPD